MKQLHDGHDEELANIISTYPQSAQPDQDMPQLLNLEPFRLGQPLNVGQNLNYIGGLDDSALSSNVFMPHPEYAEFTSDEESDFNGDIGI